MGYLKRRALGERRYYALYSQTRHLAPKVRAFVDHMTAI